MLQCVTNYSQNIVPKTSLATVAPELPSLPPVVTLNPIPDLKDIPIGKDTVTEPPLAAAGIANDIIDMSALTGALALSNNLTQTGEPP